ncbi:MAG TPA: HAMP domain-containing sensor histidine kinase [Gemmatimonadota bacterium]|nr:HAMP domain-containing sensor histidine kinase [Gemmatimonadota bacterium]
MDPTFPSERTGTVALAVGRGTHALSALANAIARPSVLARLATQHYRWLLFTIPIYAVLAHGMAAWPLAASLAGAALVYNATFSLAITRWPAWASGRTLYLRCIEIGMVCIGLSLVYVWGEGLQSQFYYDAFYAVFVVLASLSTGRRGVFISALLASLAVAVGQVMLAPAAPVILTRAGIEYWLSVLLYSGIIGLFFIAIGLLAHMARELEAHQAAERRMQEGAADGAHYGAPPAQLMEVSAHRERLAALGEVTARVVHGLSNPITGITTLTESLLEDEAGGDRETLTMVKCEADRAAQMVRELLSFVRRDPPTTSVSLNELTQRALSLWAMMQSMHDIDVVTELTAEAPRITAASSALEQVIINLLDNALHALNGNGAGRITVRTCQEDDRTVLEIADNGPGIPPEIIDQVFEPFFTTKPAGAGTGLGLAIVHTIVAECGGSVTVRSSPGEGATFSLSFPRPD